MTRSPESMALVAVVIGVAASIGGLGLSLWQDTPAGPSIVACAAVVFALSAIVGPLRRR
jgi:zinc transport system permease protein